MRTTRLSAETTTAAQDPAAGLHACALLAPSQPQLRNLLSKLTRLCQPASLYIYLHTIMTWFFSSKIGIYSCGTRPQFSSHHCSWQCMRFRSHILSLAGVGSPLPLGIGALGAALHKRLCLTVWITTTSDPHSIFHHEAHACGHCFLRPVQLTPIGHRGPEICPIHSFPPSGYLGIT